MKTLMNGNTYAGLSGFILEEDSIDLGKGIILRKTYAHLMSPFLIALSPAKLGEAHPAPWRSAAGGVAIDITVELLVPEHIGNDFEERVNIARKIVFLLRLVNNAAISLSVISSHAFFELKNIPDSECILMPLEVEKRHFPLGVSGYPETKDRIQWVKENWESSIRLYKENSNLALAIDAFDMGQKIPNTALTLVSLWAALESIFSESSSEITFRLSTLVASYLCPAGAKRIEMQKEIAKLYGKRSSAAHGNPKHEDKDLVRTFEITRDVLMKILESKSVPDKKELLLLLLGGGL